MLRVHVLCQACAGGRDPATTLTVIDIQEESKTENHHTLKRNDPAAPTELTLWRETRNKQNSLQKSQLHGVKGGTGHSGKGGWGRGGREERGPGAED